MSDSEQIHADAPARRINRTLTQKYDMHALRELQKVETDLGEKLCKLLGCDEDEHGVEIDLLTIYNSEVSKRKDLLKEMFSGVSKDTSSLVDELLAKMEEIHGSSK